MTLKGVAKFKRKLTCGLKNDIRNLVNFYASSWKSKNWHFDWIRLSKAYKYLDEKVQKSYVSWHWKVMQSLKKNWLLVPKITWGIWWVLMQALASMKICTLMCYFLSIAYKVSAKNSREELSQDTKKWSKLWKKTDFLIKNWEGFGKF